MKKIYQTPGTFVSEMELQHLLIESPLEDGFNLGDAPTTTVTSGNLSRHRSLWDDEDEDYDF